MKVLFWLTTNRKFKPENYHKTPFGGCEIECFHVAEQLWQNDVDVYIAANVERIFLFPGIGTFIPYDKIKSILQEVEIDFLICVRAHKSVLNPRYRSRVLGEKAPLKTILWSGDSFDQPNNETLHDIHTIKTLDAIILKGKWQKEKWIKHFPLLSIIKNRVHIISKSLKLEYFTNTIVDIDKPRFIYASTAYRGLHNFLKIWPLVKEDIPNATLDCFCQTTLYLENNPSNLTFAELYRKISELEDVEIKEPLSQKDFLHKIKDYYLMLYPNSIWDETVGGVVLESMASGVPVITTARAGLIETVGDVGFLIEEENKSYNKYFVKKVKDLWANKDLRKQKAEYGFQVIREKHSVKTVIKEWMRILQNILCQESL